MKAGENIFIALKKHFHLIHMFLLVSSVAHATLTEPIQKVPQTTEPPACARALATEPVMALLTAFLGQSSSGHLFRANKDCNTDGLQQMDHARRIISNNKMQQPFSTRPCTYEQFKAINSRLLTSALHMAFKTKEEFLEFLSNPDAKKFRKMKFEFQFPTSTLTTEDWRHLRSLSQTLVYLQLSRSKYEYNLGPNGMAQFAAALAPEDATPVTPPLGLLPQLRYLDISENRIRDAGLATLADGLRHLPNLFALDISYNSIEDEGAMALAHGLSHVQHLASLSVRQNNISDVGTAALANGLRYVPNLSLLNISNNDIHEAGASALAHGLIHVPNLCSLDISHTSIRDAGLSALMEGLRHVPNLSSLSLNSTGIGDPGAIALVNGLGYIPKLSLIDIFGVNDFTNRGKATLTRALVPRNIRQRKN
jgi:Ran GTPase-activating protein (RanGAP) involved in mRNA processing and transport